MSLPSTAQSAAESAHTRAWWGDRGVMSRSVQEAAGGTGQIADNTVGVSGAAEATTQALTQTRTAVDELSRMAADLRTNVGRFSL